LLVVIKTKYVYDSEIYSYYTNVFRTFEVATSNDMFLNKRQSKICFISVYLGLIMLSTEFCQGYAITITCFIAFTSVLLILDTINNLYILQTADVKLSSTSVSAISIRMN
jgi:hypothetical protein